jgi:hypothetical protein
MLRRISKTDGAIVWERAVCACLNRIYTTNDGYLVYGSKNSPQESTILSIKSDGNGAIQYTGGFTIMNLFQTGGKFTGDIYIIAELDASAYPGHDFDGLSVMKFSAQLNHHWNVSIEEYAASADSLGFSHVISPIYGEIIAIRTSGNVPLIYLTPQGRKDYAIHSARYLSCDESATHCSSEMGAGEINTDIMASGAIRLKSSIEIKFPEPFSEDLNPINLYFDRETSWFMRVFESLDPSAPNTMRVSIPPRSFESLQPGEHMIRARLANGNSYVLFVRFFDSTDETLDADEEQKSDAESNGEKAKELDIKEEEKAAIGAPKTGLVSAANSVALSFSALFLAACALIARATLRTMFSRKTVKLRKRY